MTLGNSFHHHNYMIQTYIHRGAESFAHHMMLMNSLTHPYFYNLVRALEYITRLNLCALQILQVL